MCVFSKEKMKGTKIRERTNVACSETEVFEESFAGTRLRVPGGCEHAKEHSGRFDRECLRFEC